VLKHEQEKTFSYNNCELSFRGCMNTNWEGFRNVECRIFYIIWTVVYILENGYEQKNIYFDDTRSGVIIQEPLWSKIGINL
jgi:hypothetical protein